MAGTYKQIYEQIIKDKKARQQAIIKNDTSVGKKISDQQHSIDNIETRLKAGGVDVDKEKDSRNALEKFLGLPEDQNFIFDIFELLGRPQQALFGAINAAQKGEDAGDAAWAHFKGDKETNFKEILTEAGMSDRKGKLDFADILGFTGDVLLDPVDLALIPVTMGGSVAASAAMNTADTAVDTARAAGKAAKAVKAADNVVDTAKAVDNTLDAAKAGKKAVKFKSVSDLAFEGAGKAIKGSAKLADTGIEKVLKYLDETKGVKDSAGNIAKIGYTNINANTASDLGKYLRNSDEFLEVGEYVPKGNLEKYKEVKETISNAFRVKDGTKKALRASKEADFLTDQTKGRIAKELKKFDDDVIEFTKTSKMTADDVNKAMTDMKEYKGLSRSKKGKDVLKAAQEGVLKDTVENRAVLDEIADTVNKADRTYGGAPFKLDYTVDDNGMIKLGRNWNSKILEDAGVSLDQATLDKMFDIGANYTDEQLEYLSKLEKDKKFMKFFEKHKNLDNVLNNIISEEFGIDFAKKYAQNEGYVPHVMKNKFGTMSGGLKNDDIPVLKGNTKVLSDRTRLGSVLEENAAYNDIISKNYDNLSDAGKKYVDKHRDLFERNYSAAMSKKYLDELPTLLKDNKILTETLVNQSLGNVDDMVKMSREIEQASIMGDKDLMRKLSEQYNSKFGNSNIKVLSSDGKAPLGYTKIGGKGKHYAEKLDRLADQLGADDIKQFTDQLRKNSDYIAIDSSILNMIDILDDRKSVNALGRMYDNWLSFYKRNKVLSPTFHMNNILGNTNNMWLSGVSITDQAKYMPDAFRVTREGAQLSAKRAAGEILSKADNRIADVYDELAKAGFGAGKFSASELQDLPEAVIKYMKGDRSKKTLSDLVINGLPALSAKANELFDNMSRSVLIMKGLDDPKYLMNLGVDNAADAMRKVMFDPSELTSFEKDYLKRIMPFYTFAKKNLAYQLDNLGRNGRKYSQMIKALESLQDAATGGNEELMADYIRNSMYVPIPSLGEDGSYRIVRAQIPFGNLLDFTEDPTRGIVNMLGPIAKYPYEKVTGINSFTGKEIEKYPGEMSSNIPFLTKKQEHTLGNLTGLDVPLKHASNLYTGINETLSNGGSVPEGIFKGIEKSTTMTQNVNDDKLYKMYRDLDELETIMQQYKGRGYEFSTINELNKANKHPKIEQIMAKINKLNGVRENPYSHTNIRGYGK